MNKIGDIQAIYRNRLEGTGLFRKGLNWGEEAGSKGSKIITLKNGRDGGQKGNGKGDPGLGDKVSPTSNALSLSSSETSNR